MAVEYARAVLLALIPLVAVPRLDRALVLVPLALAFIVPIVRYVRFRYTVLEGSLVLEGGLLSRWRREVPFARVQSIDSVQKLRHRLFGVVELRIEVVGGRATEASFPALDPREAERIRSTVLSGARDEASAESAPHLARMTVFDLLLAGATGGRVAVFALLIGYLQEVLPKDVAVGAIERLAASGITAIIVTVSAFLLVAVIISLVATVIVYWELTLRRDREHIVVTRGLLERRRALIPSHRVQALRVHANPVRRVLGLASVSAVLAGYNVKRDEQQETSMLLPVARHAEAFRIALELVGAPQSLEGEGLEGLPLRALAHRLIHVTLAALVVGAVASVIWGAPGAWAFVLLPLGAAWAWLSWRAAGHVVVEDHVVVRSGALSRRHYIVPVANVQHLELRSSPLQRALTLATLRLRIPKAAPGLVGLARPRADDRFRALARLLER